LNRAIRNASRLIPMGLIIAHQRNFRGFFYSLNA